MCLSLCVLEGGWDHEDHEGLHQHDRQEALQRHVRHQHRQRLDQVIETSQTDYGLVSNEITSERKKSLCWTRKHEHTKWGEKREVWKTAGPYYSFLGETYHTAPKHNKAPVMWSLPPLMLAPPLLAFSFNLISSFLHPVRLINLHHVMCSLLLFKPFPHFPASIVLGTKWTPPFESHWEPFF